MIEKDDIKVGDSLIAVEDFFLKGTMRKYATKGKEYEVLEIVYEPLELVTHEWGVRICDDEGEDHYFTLRYISPSNMKDNDTMFQLTLKTKI